MKELVKKLELMAASLRSAETYLCEDLDCICDETMREYAESTLAEVRKGLKMAEELTFELQTKSRRDIVCGALEQEGFFYITSVHRDDLESCGFDTSEVTDEQMRRLAGKMSDDYCIQMFHESMAIIAECMGFPKREDDDEE